MEAVSEHWKPSGDLAAPTPWAPMTSLPSESSPLTRTGAVSSCCAIMLDLGIRFDVGMLSTSGDVNEALCQLREEAGQTVRQLAARPEWSHEHLARTGAVSPG